MAINTVIMIGIAYLCGSIPFSYLVARIRGVDLLKVGSGNVGGANVWRSCGFGPFLFAMVLDLLKGTVPTLVAIQWLALPPIAVIFVSASVMLGHTRSVFLGFKGGKAVATGGGVLLAIFPLAMLIGALAWITAFALTRISSVGSLTATSVVMMVTLVTFLIGQIDLVYALFICIAAMLVIVLHRANIQRLLSGTENRFQKL